MKSTTSRDTMMNSINQSYNNYSKKNKNLNKSEDKSKEDIKENENDFKKDSNKTLCPKHKIVREIKKSENKIRVSKIDKKETKENTESKNEEKSEKIGSKKKEKFETKENKESKEVSHKKESSENKKSTKIINEKNIDITKLINKKSDEKEDEDEVKKKYFDTSKIDNVQIPKEYINVIYYNLLKEEEKGINPMPDHTYMPKQREINDKMRSILVDWIIDVHFKFGFTDETLFMTISIIDRYLSICQISRTNFQLLGITALMIACKHEEIDLPKIDDFIYITDNAYVKNEVVRMEEDVLYKLNFSFLYPSPKKFFEYLSLHFNFSKKQHMMGKYLMESFLLDVKNVKYKPSIISCACTYIVMKFFKMPNYHESYDKKFFNLEEKCEKYSEHNIKECAKDICLLVDNINKTNYQACLKKYSKPEQEKVSILIMNN